HRTAGAWAVRGEIKLFLSLVDGLFELFSCAETYGFGSRYLYSFGGVRIVTAARLSMGNCKRTKADQGYLVVLAQTVSNRFLHSVDRSFGLGLTDRGPLRHLLDQIALVHRTS